MKQGCAAKGTMKQGCAAEGTMKQICMAQYVALHGTVWCAFEGHVGAGCALRECSSTCDETRLECSSG